MNSLLALKRGSRVLGSSRVVRLESVASRNELFAIMSDDMLLVHSRTCGRMYTRKASDDHRPRIMILWTGWFIKKSDMAAPDRSDFVPMSSASNPNTFFPPISVHVVRMWVLSSSLVMWVVFVDIRVTLIWAFSPASGINRRIRVTRDTRFLTGHSTGSFVRWWVRLSIFNPFFWFSNVRVTRSADNINSGQLCSSSLWLTSRNTTPRSLITLVLPGSGVDVISQDRIATK